MEISESLINITEKIGKDINLVQGPGGNISFKRDGFMYIKASGEKMSDAKNKNIFVKTDHNKILACLEKNDPDPIKNNWEKSSLMRPSIETTIPTFHRIPECGFTQHRSPTRGVVSQIEGLFRIYVPVFRCAHKHPTDSPQLNRHHGWLVQLYHT